MRKFFGFGSSTPPPPAPPSKPPAPPAKPALAPAAAPSLPAAPAPVAEVKPVAAPPAAAVAPAPSLVGRWREPGSSDTTEFHADGSVIESTGDEETIRGRYSLENKVLTINLEGVDELTFPIALGPDTLEMTDEEGKITHYERIR